MTSPTPGSKGTGQHDGGGTDSISDLAQGMLRLVLFAMKMHAWGMPRNDISKELRRWRASVAPSLSDLNLDIDGLLDRLFGEATDPTTGNAEGGLSRFESIADIAQPAQADAYLVEGFLRPHTLGVVAAYDGTGKSWMRLQLGLTLATGGMFLGHYRVPHPVTVGVIDEENGPEEEWRREQEMIAELGSLDRADYARYHRTSFTGIVLTSSEGRAALEAAIVGFLVPGTPTVVILDTATSMVDGKEWGEELKPVIRFLRGLLKTYPDLTLLLIVHTNKPRGERRTPGTELTDVVGNWTRLVDVVAVMAPLGLRVEGKPIEKVRWRLHKKVPRSDLVLARDGVVWRAQGDYSPAGSSKIDPEALFAFVAAEDEVTSAQVASKFKVSRKTAISAMRSESRLEARQSGGRGGWVARVKTCEPS